MTLAIDPIGTGKSYSPTAPKLRESDANQLLEEVRQLRAAVAVYRAIVSKLLAEREQASRCS